MSASLTDAERHNARAVRMRLIRQLHLWVAVFVAPTLLLFTMTGMLQLFGLHEARDSYKPAPVVEKLGQVHIHQTYALRPVRRPPTAQQGPAAATPEKKAESGQLGVTLTKWAFLTMGLGITLSSALGVWMAMSNARQRRTAIVLLIAGTLLPVLVLAL